MSDMFPFMRTALLNGTGIQGMRVNSQDEYATVESASRAINKAALSGKKWIPMIGNVDFQNLTDGQVAKAEEFLLAMQSLDNYRLSLYGLENGGLFQKKAHVLESEQAMNQGNTSLVLQDSLKYRQDACTIINSVWGLNMWCMPSETVSNVDMNGDGVIGSQEDTYTAPEGNEEVENSDIE
jgi:hypothetical protein